MIGKTLAHYEITALLGKGGMGEVYRATDTKLGREVALKLLPTDFANDIERLARFQREARTLASLHHARIASLFGIEEIEGETILVMELVEGQDLSERLATSGALPMEDVVSVAIQIAEGLEFAHDHAVMHRDLKPANVKITPQGEIKLLDFGLARAFTGDSSDEGDLANSPTITAALTHAGVILGTAAYMSPEQAKGRSVDRRADIWAYGVILYELLTGRQMFQAETVSETMAEVMKGEIEWDALPKKTPVTLRRLLERCLDRDPTTRLRDIGEARVALVDLRARRGEDPLDPPAAAPTARFRRERLVWIVLLLVMLAGIVGISLMRPGGADRSLVQTTLLPPPGWDFAPATPFAISPDGKRIAYVAFPRPDSDERGSGTNTIWVRDLDSPEPRELTSSDGDAYPFWSPDGRWIGFFGGRKLNKIESRGGPVIPLCDTTDGRGGSWNKEGVIIFQGAWSEGLMRIPAGGGTPQPLTELNVEHTDIAHRWPQFLPDGKHFLYFVASTMNPMASEYSGIYVGSLDSDESQMLMQTESRALYAQGHLLYRIGTTLMARPFDVSSRRLTGDPSPVATDIPGGQISWGGAQFGVSESGLLVHMRGAQLMSTVLNWRDSSGNTLETVGEPGAYWEPNLSHDGMRVALAAGKDVCDIWIYDLQGDMKTRFSFDPSDERTPLWSPDDDQIVYTSAESAIGEIYLRPVSGQEPAKLIYTAEAQVVLSDWSGDGRHVFFHFVEPGENGWDVWALDMESYQAEPVLMGPGDQLDARLSPDGRYLAFSSDESGQTHIYVQSYPVASGRWMISTDKVAGRAYSPLWSKDGKKLFYTRGSALLAVPVSMQNAFASGTPQYLFSLNLSSTNAAYQLSPDGQKILTNEMPTADRDAVGARLIQNWTALLAE